MQKVTRYPTNKQKLEERGHRSALAQPYGLVAELPQSSTNLIATGVERSDRGIDRGHVCEGGLEAAIVVDVAADLVDGARQPLGGIGSGDDCLHFFTIQGREFADGVDNAVGCAVGVVVSLAHRIVGSAKFMRATANHLGAGTDGHAEQAQLLGHLGEHADGDVQSDREFGDGGASGLGHGLFPKLG